MDSLLEKLAYAANSRGVPENINLLGRRAAKKFLEKEADSLTSAVSDLAKEHRLSKAEIQQLAQSANQTTWTEGFHSTNDGTFQFDPANADDVFDATAERGSEIREPNLDYYKDPEGEPADMRSDWDAFADKELHTSSTPEHESLDPLEDVGGAKEKVAGATDFVRRRVDEITAETQYEGERLYQMFHDAHMQEGAGILQLSKVASTAFDDQEFGAAVMRTVVERMTGEGIRFDNERELQKMASATLPNPEHSLYKKCQEFEKLARALAFRADQYEDFKAGTRRLDEIIRDRLSQNG